MGKIYWGTFPQTPRVTVMNVAWQLARHGAWEGLEAGVDSGREGVWDDDDDDARACSDIDDRNDLLYRREGRYCLFSAAAHTQAEKVTVAAKTDGP